MTDRWDRKQNRENYRAGLAPAAILNLFLPKHKQKEPLDFFREKKAARQTPRQMMAVMKAFTLAHGGRVRTKKKDGDNR